MQRVLPFRKRRMIGPFIFADLIGPETLAAGTGIDVDAHPHIGLSTLTLPVRRADGPPRLDRGGRDHRTRRGQLDDRRHRRGPHRTKPRRRPLHHSGNARTADLGRTARRSRERCRHLRAHRGRPHARCRRRADRGRKWMVDGVARRGEFAARPRRTPPHRRSTDRHRCHPPRARRARDRRRARVREPQNSGWGSWRYSRPVPLRS